MHALFKSYKIILIIYRLVTWDVFNALYTVVTNCTTVVKI